MISGNLDLSAEALLDGKVLNHVVLEVGGEKIGVISALATDTVDTSSPGENVIFRDEIEALAEDVATLEAQGVNKIIALTHVGLPMDLRIAEAVPGIDVIVGGHSHTLLSNTSDRASGAYPMMVGDTAVAQAYAYSKYLGNLTVTFDDDGNVVSAEGEPMLLDASIEPDADMLARVAEMGTPIEEMRGRNDAIRGQNGFRYGCWAGHWPRNGAAYGPRRGSRDCNRHRCIALGRCAGAGGAAGGCHRQQGGA